MLLHNGWTRESLNWLFLSTEVFEKALSSLLEIDTPLFIKILVTCIFRSQNDFGSFDKGIPKFNHRALSVFAFDFLSFYFK